MDIVLFDFSFLTIIAIASLFIGWEDIKERKIRNRWVIGGLSAGILLFGIAFFYGVVDFGYLIKVLINTSISFVVGFAVWRLGFWPAGDSKFFITLSFLLPLHYYSGTYLPYFPSFVLLINSFAVFLFFCSMKSIFYFLKNFVASVMIDNYWREWWGQRWTSQHFNFAIFREDKIVLGNAFRKILIQIVGCLLLVVFLLRGNADPQLFCSYFLFFAILELLLNFYIRNHSKCGIRVCDLAAGMSLADDSVSELKKNKDLFEKIGVLRPDGLERSQVDLIKQHWHAREMEDIYIFNVIPFAPWIILGALVTILFKGNLMQFIQNWFR